MSLVLKFKLKRETLFPVFALLLVGCGGGAAPAGPIQSVQSLKVGDASITYQGTAKPSVLTYESGLTVSSVAGASFSNLTVEPGANLNDTMLAYMSNTDGSVQTYQRGASSFALNLPNLFAWGVGFGHDGKIYAGAEGSNPLTYQITRIYYDGSFPVNIFTPPFTPFNIAVSPNNSEIVFDGSGGLAEVNSSGGNYKVLDANGYHPCISPDGTTIAYCRVVSGVSQIFTMPILGGTATQLTSGGGNAYYPCYTPDGGFIVCDDDDGSSRQIVELFGPGPEAGEEFTVLANGPWDSHPAFSPDGHYMAYDTASSYSSPTPKTIQVQDIYGNQQQFIGSGFNPVWSPFLPNRTFVGTGGAMYTSAVAGFLYSQVQSGFQGLLSFTATTPSSATSSVTGTSSPSGGSPIVFDVHADKITGLKYVNGYFLNPISVTPNVSDTLVTIDSTTGNFVSLLPFVATRGVSAKPTITAAGLVYIAHFTAVYDAHGKNLAPNGASSITLDPKHGTVVSLH